jgi:hypothetical protein
MDDYHEFRCAHDIQIDEWWLYWSPNYVSIIRGIVAPSGVTTTLGISSASGNESANGSGITKNVGTTKSGGPIGAGGVGASTSTHGPLPTFNLVVEFFYELQ